MAWNNVVYSAGTIEDREQLEYVQLTGVNKVTIHRIFGTDSKDGRSKFIHVEVKTADGKLITTKDLYSYTAKANDAEKKQKIGDIINSKGYNIVAGIVGMVSGKEKASAKWTKCVVKQYGQDVNAMELKSLVGKALSVKTQIKHYVYEDKENNDIATTECMLTRVFSKDGLALSEYEAALGDVKDGKIESVSEYPQKAIITETKRAKDIYYKITKEEWDELYAEQNANSGKDKDNEGSKDSSSEELPSIDSDELPPVEEEATPETTPVEVETVDELPPVEEAVVVPPVEDELPPVEEDDDDALPNIDDIDLDG